MSARLLYDIPEASEQLSVSERVIARLIKDGEIDSVKLGRRRLVPHEAIVDYIKRLQEAS